MLLAATVLAAKKEADAAAAPSCSGSQFVSGGSAANGLITCYNNAGVGKSVLRSSARRSPVLGRPVVDTGARRSPPSRVW